MRELSDYLSRFPEELFTASPKYKTAYIKSLVRGYQRLSRSRVNIIGLARNLGGNTRYLRMRLNKIGSLTRDYRVYIYENDSTDNTAALLKSEAEKNDRWRVLSEQTGVERFESVKTMDRAIHMARCRNRLMNMVVTRGFDYTILVDTDLDGGYSYDGLAHTFSLPNWSFVGANGIIYQKGENGYRRLYYDSWAFRRINAISAHLDEEINLLHFNRGEPLVAVDSCFGGIGVYKSEAYFSGIQYGFKNSLDEPECDHVTLNRQLKSAGHNCYLNPSLITMYTKSPHQL